MVTKKDLVIAVLTTFCLTATLFMIVPTESSHSIYDPWLDTNGDGQINILDLSASAIAFGTSGDPTKPVEIAERRVEENAIDFAIELGTHVNITIPAAGFRIIAVSIWVYSLPTRYFDMFVGYRAANRFLNSSLITQFTDYPIIIIQPEWYENIREPKFSWTEEVWFSELVITIINSHSENVMTGSVVYYLST